MFPLPIRLIIKFKPASPIVQKVMSSMMSWMMDNEDGKVRAGKVLKDINEVKFVQHLIHVSFLGVLCYVTLV